MKICEIFASIQGESSFAGLPCVFVRTAGCNLRCSYCDTAYAYEDGIDMPVARIVEAVRAYGIGVVEITGGEPLLQPRTRSLISALCDTGHTVLLETNGSIGIGDIDARAVVIMDIKTPGSGMSEHMDYRNLERLRPVDELKFVLTGRGDYEWARDFLLRHGELGRREALLSPVYGILPPRDLSRWILEDRLPVRLNLQIHKYIYGPDERGV